MRACKSPFQLVPVPVHTCQFSGNLGDASTQGACDWLETHMLNMLISRTVSVGFYGA